MASDEAFISILNAVLAEVCSRCNFVHAEALQPSGAACMVQSGANYSTTSGGADFHRASVNFVYPPYVCIPGRVWKTQQSEWHKNVSELPVSLFIRADIAKITDLKSCFAMPLGRKGQISAVLLFYSSHAIPYSRNLEQTIIFLANDILSEVCSKKGSHVCSDLQFFTQGEHPAPKKSQSVISKVWESAKAALAVPAEQRSEAHVADIIKFSKRLPFFKYVTNTSREVLCKYMEIIQLEDGEVVVRSQERQEFVWYIVIKGSADLVLCTEPGAQAYVVHAFQEGDTFAHPYMDLYTNGVTGIEGCIRASEPATSCVRVMVPSACREDFRAQTKPLWYKELAVYFYLSVDEAAEKLGMCMSAIKKVCRRHGIIRWPHRKLLGADKALAVLASKVASTSADPVARAAWQTEAVNILVAKLRLTLDPKYLSDWVQLDPMVPGGGGGGGGGGGPAAAGRVSSGLGGSALLVEGHSTSDEDSPPDAPDPYPAQRPGMSKMSSARRHAPAVSSASMGRNGGGGVGSGGPLGALTMGGGDLSGLGGDRGGGGLRLGRGEDSGGGVGRGMMMNGGGGSTAARPRGPGGGGEKSLLEGMEGMEGLYQQLQMVPLHAREAVLVRLLEVQRMAAAAQSAHAERQSSLRDLGCAGGGLGGLGGGLSFHPSEMHGGLPGLPGGPGLYDDGPGWRPGDFGRAAGGGTPGLGGFRMDGLGGDGGQLGGMGRLGASMGLSMRGPVELESVGALQGKAPLSGLKPTGPDPLGRAPLQRPEPWGLGNSLEAAHRRGDEDADGGLRMGGGGGGGEGHAGLQARKNIHLLCDMLGGAPPDPPPGLRRKRDLDGGPGSPLPPPHLRARHASAT